jgi:hypothetical protein
MSKNAPFQIRQGDVLLELVDELPPGAKEQPLDKERGLVIAEGEATGHSHRIPHRHARGAASAYRTEMDARFMRVTAPVPLRHEEHKTRCATCATAGIFTIATARLASCFDRDGYLCQEHAATADVDVVALAEPGASDIPAGDYRITIHAEYQPGELPRNVAD